MSGAGRPGLSASRLREIALEAVLIVFAVLVALAVQEWWEDRERQQRANDALVAVGEELQRNLAELTDNAPENDSAGVAIGRVLAGEPVAADALGLSLSLLRSDVWNAAQTTGATAALDLGWIARISQLYGIQEMYLIQQDRLLESFADYVALAPTGSGEEALRYVQTQLLFLQQFQCSLGNGYELVIEELNTGELNPASLTERLDETC